MKKIILFSLLIFTSIPGFSYNYREILFGNNYKNITECTDDEISKIYENRARLGQWVYIKVNGVFHEISYGYIYIKLLIHLMKNLRQLP